MSMPAAERLWSVEEVLELPADGNRYEVVDGELLVTPAPRLLHQWAITEIVARLLSFLEGEPIGYLFMAPADIAMGPRTLVQPDVFVVAPVNARRPREWSEVERLLLAIEVLSPSTARADRVVKRRLYQRQRVPEYWVIDLDARVVERWLPDEERAALFDQTIEWSPDGARSTMRLDLSQYFAVVHGEG